MTAPLTPFEETGEWADLVQESAFVAQTYNGPQKPLSTHLGTSHNQHPIHAYTFGQTTGGLLIIASQHGDEPAPREAALQLMRNLAYSTEQPPVPVTIIPTPNPDGTEADTRQNGAGDDINRTHINLTTPEANAIAAAINKFAPVLIFDGHEKHSDATLMDFKAYERVTAPPLRTTGNAAKTALQALFAPEDTADHPVNAHEGTLVNTSNWRGITAMLGESLRYAEPEERVAWNLAVMNELVEYVKAHKAELLAASIEAQEFYAETGYYAHGDYYAYDSGFISPCLGYLVDSYLEPTLLRLGARTVATQDVSKLYVPMDQKHSLILPMLLDPRAPRPAFEAEPVFWGDDPPIDFLAKPDPMRLPTHLNFGGQEPRRLITKEGVVWGT